jgi:hypothetical protein
MRSIVKHALLFLCLASTCSALTPAPPRGVFNLGEAGNPVPSEVIFNPDVDGISLRIGWSLVNPSEDVYDWSYFDTEITRAQNAGKKVLIRVSDGGKSVPDWVRAASAAAGEPTFSFYAAQDGAVITQPVFWAPTLLANKAKLMAAFGARYDSNPTVAIVTCQFAGARNDDWSVPDGTTVDGIAPSGSTEVSRWLAAGWTTAKMVDAGNEIVANTMAAFPSKPVGLAIGRTSTELTPEGQDYIAQTVINTARAKWGDRMVATHNNISEKATPPPPPAGSFWSLIYDLRPAVGGQMLWFSYGDPTCRNAANGAPCDAATVLTHSVERAHDYGWNYLEIYSADIVGLPSVIHYAHGLLTQSPVSGGASAGATFVIGDKNAVVGQHVTFWGKRWAKRNSLSGGGAPKAFKGFAMMLSTNPPVCGGAWSSGPGRAEQPPAAIASPITVIVASSIAWSGTVISGDIVKMATIQSDPGYRPNLRHAGTGTVVSVTCTGP